MYIEHIIRELKDLIYLNKLNYNNTYENKNEARRHEDLSDALWGLDIAMDGFSTVDERLNQIIDMIEMEAISAKVQSK